MRLACACKCQCRCECGYCSEWGCERVVCVCLKQVVYRCCIAEPALFSNNAAAAAQSSATLTHDILHSRNLHQQHARRKPGWRYQLTGTWQSTMGTSPAASRAAMALRALALRGGLHAALADAPQTAWNMQCSSAPHCCVSTAASGLRRSEESLHQSKMRLGLRARLQTIVG